MKALEIAITANEGHSTEINETKRIMLNEGQAAVAEAFIFMLDTVDMTPGDGEVDFKDTARLTVPVMRLFGKQITAKVTVPYTVSLDVVDA